MKSQETIPWPNADNGRRVHPRGISTNTARDPFGLTVPTTRTSQSEINASSLRLEISMSNVIGFPFPTRVRLDPAKSSVGLEAEFLDEAARATDATRNFDGMERVFALVPDARS